MAVRSTNLAPLSASSLNTYVAPSIYIYIYAHNMHRGTVQERERVTETEVCGAYVKGDSLLQFRPSTLVHTQN